MNFVFSFTKNFLVCSTRFTFQRQTPAKMTAPANNVPEYNNSAEAVSHNHFYFHIKDATAIKNRAMKTLTHGKWEPHNCEIANVLIVPNDATTYHVILKFANEKEITLAEFMTLNKLGWQFFYMD